jgi:SET domain-containing protein
MVLFKHTYKLLFVVFEMKKLKVLRSSIEGKGIFADENIRKNEHIAYIQGSLKRKIITSKTQAQSIPLWYGITKTLWLDPENTIWRYFNHSCNPNTAITGQRKLIALTNIKRGSEITFDYSMTDGDTLWEMPCSCRSENCRKVIKSIQLLDDKTFKNHMPFVPKYFVALRKKFKAQAR